MNKIIYVDGWLADQLGRSKMEEIAQDVSNALRVPIDLLTHGASKFHSYTRVSVEPQPRAPT